MMYRVIFRRDLSARMEWLVIAPNPKAARQSATWRLEAQLKQLEDGAAELETWSWESTEAVGA